jgi:hypothetical protein
MSEPTTGIQIVLTVCCPKAEQFGYGTCSNNPVKWRWCSCNHQTYIDDRGDCICQNSSCSIRSFLKYVGFKCGSTEHGNDFVNYKLKELVFALQMATKAVAVNNSMGEMESLDFLENMTKNIRQNWGS